MFGSWNHEVTYKIEIIKVRGKVNGGWWPYFNIQVRFLSDLTDVKSLRTLEPQQRQILKGWRWSLREQEGDVRSR